MRNWMFQTLQLHKLSMKQITNHNQKSVQIVSKHLRTQHTMLCKMWKLGTRRPQPSAEKSPTGPLQVSIAMLEWPPSVKSGNGQSLEGFTWFPSISCNSGFLIISLRKLVPLWLDRYGPRNQKTIILDIMISYIFVSSVTLIACHFKMSMCWKLTCFIICIVLWTCSVLVWWWVFGDRNILQLFTEYLWSLFGPNSFESWRLASFVSWLVVTPGSISSCDTSKCAETCLNGNCGFTVILKLIFVDKLFMKTM